MFSRVNMKTSTKYFKVVGLSVQVNSDLPMTRNTFHPKFKLFETLSPEKENLIIHHHFDFFDHRSKERGERVYCKPPWEICRNHDDLTYQWIYPKKTTPFLRKVAYTDIRHQRVDIYNDDFTKIKYLSGNLEFLSMFPTDQILLGAALAYLNGCIFHSSGVEVNGKGFLFLGHSGVGKSTVASMFSDRIDSSKILCEDRNILRKIDNDFFMSSAWSHGDIKRLSSDCPPVNAIFFLCQSNRNRLTPVTDRLLLTGLLLKYLIKSFAIPAWWDKILDLIEQIIREIPCWNLEFDKTGGIVEKIISV